MKIPKPISKDLTFRWFVEYIIDNSPLFKTASAIAKVGLILAADLDTVDNETDVPEPALAILRLAVTSAHRRTSSTGSQYH
jgi:hypothetical protein